MKNYRFKPAIPALWLPLVLSVFFVFAGNFVLLGKIWSALKALDHVNPGFALSIPVFLIAVFHIGITLLSARRIVKPLFIGLILLSAMLTYAMFTYGIVFDKSMIANFAETNVAEAGSYLNWSVVGWMIVFGVLPAALLAWVPVTTMPLKRSVLLKFASIGVSLTIIAIIAVFYFRDYASFIRNNPPLRKDVVPTYAIDATYSYIKKTYFARPKPYRYVGLNAKQLDPDHGRKKELVVLIVGETQRAMNYELNGYGRPTNHYTQKHDVVSFPHVTSCGTATAVSVPCMFSNLSKAAYEKETAETQDNVLDIAKRSGVHVLWLDNDSGCKEVCNNVETVDVREKYSQDKTQCVGDGCHDSVLLQEFSERIKTLPDTTSLVVLHIMGSHGPTYFNRYPADHRVFAPDCPRSDIQNCTHDELLNTYDNTILYSDFIMSGIIDVLKQNSDKRNSMLMFMSDHGESLGEKGVYLHGLPYSVAPDEQTHVPFISWMSDGFAKDRGIDTACVKNTLTKGHYSHDNLFHTVLGLLAIHVDAYQENMDVFAPCKTLPQDYH